MSKESEKNLAGNITLEIPLSLLEPNEGQLEGLPANPRIITDEKFTLLKQNIQQYPEMLSLRGLLVYPLGDKKYIIIGGNMRYQAMLDLGITSAPCTVIPSETPVEKLKAYTIIDNNGFGKWNWDLLANEWDTSDLKNWGIDPSFFGGDEVNVDSFFEDAANSTLDKDEKITVTVGGDDKDHLEDIKAIIRETLTDYPSIKVQ